ncbi:hypothetical protein M3Y94_00912800 [Aphelenchoides besseyi]|nr:hypothetical protein M3Y94_00912800 [Aphelenchoides besseyi]
MDCIRVLQSVVPMSFGSVGMDRRFDTRVHTTCSIEQTPSIVTTKRKFQIARLQM